MHIPILIEPLEGGRYRARAGEPVGLSAEGATKDEARQALRRCILERLSGGAELSLLEVPVALPWAPQPAGPDTDRFFEELREAMAENRRREDADVP